jgi:hypothetical protein
MLPSCASASAEKEINEATGKLYLAIVRRNLHTLRLVDDVVVGHGISIGGT